MLDPYWIAFAATILSGLPTELAGALTGSLISGRVDKLNRQLALAQPDSNHDLQKALTDSFWLTVLYVVAQHGEQAGESSKALSLPFNLGGAWSVLQSLSPTRLWQGGREERAEREKIRLLARQSSSAIDTALARSISPSNSARSLLILASPFPAVHSYAK